MFKLEYKIRAKKQLKKIEKSGQIKVWQDLLKIIKQNPFLNPPPYEKLKGHNHRYSRRINIKHRIEYDVIKDKMIIEIRNLWGHYDDNG